MKKRATVFLNFVAFNLLFFALYLNFVHKDAIAAPAIHQQMHTSGNQNVQADQSIKVTSNATTITGENKSL
jgi:hypothetical protein